MPGFEGVKVTVMGLGHFGGGVGAVRWLAAQGADVLVTDLSPPEKLENALAQIRDLVDSGRVRLRLGDHNVADFTTRDLVVASPAVPRPWDNRFLRAAGAAGHRVTTEIGLLVSHLPAGVRTIGVTGSAGKSTTSAMVHHILASTGRRAVLGGNIGGSLLPVLATEVGAARFVVLELSSAMLHWLDAEGLAWSPHVAVLTNVSNNHTDWHGSFEHYQQCKRRILEHQGPGSVALFGRGAPDWPARPAVRAQRVGDEVSGILLPGAHNRRNAGVAVQAALAGDATLTHAQALAAVRTFAGLPHRLEFVARAAGARWYNDSKCTTPEAALLAVAAFDEPGECGRSRVHLVAGGYDKGSDLTPIARLAPDLAGLYTLGKTGPTLAANARAAGAQVEECGFLGTAVERIAATVGEGDVVLLSPACASWDQFANYERRGELFRELVHGLEVRCAR